MNVYALAPRSFLPALALLGLVFTAACEHPPSNVTVEDTPASDAAAPTVSLPEPPSEQDFVIPEKNDDGTFRVAGLVEYKAKYLDKGTEVVVSGLITSMSKPCDPGKAKKTGEKCLEPHLLIKDDEEEANKYLLIVGYKDDFLKKAKIKEGEVHQFKGTYQSMGFGFTASEDGLLVLAGIDDKDIAE